MCVLMCRYADVQIKKCVETQYFVSYAKLRVLCNVQVLAFIVKFGRKRDAARFYAELTNKCAFDYQLLIKLL